MNSPFRVKEEVQKECKNYIAIIHKDVFLNQSKNLDDKITQYGQAISMNTYETNINNNILYIVISIFGIMIFVFIILIVYYHHKTAGKFTLFGMQ
jgi:hypothetical protein